MRKELHHQVKNNILRSLDLESLNIHVSPTSKISFPTIIRLYPPTPQPPLRHINMPMRFGRNSFHGDDHNPNSAPNMPQRFGRSWKKIQLCEGCYEAHRILKHRVKHARNGQRFISTLLNAQLLKSALHWTAGAFYSQDGTRTNLQDAGVYRGPQVLQGPRGQR
ncbi:unnamed protein product [Tetraodon nigroviridis]|uniref:(spotted green pufferfish) hypothetical protein n=1 Tax=Tetraodon nigroviridis TaxID=99883 RepID=Q4SIV6_TETNG|nr:unnamed protein product [Tetraodon nigroviridis]